MSERVVTVKFGAQISDYVAGVSRMKRATKDATDDAAKRLAEQREAMHQLGGDSLKMGLALAAGMALSSKAALDWQSAWTGVTKTVDGTPEQLAAIEDGLRGLARELPATHAEIAAVAEAAGQLGVKADSVVDFTKVMVDLGETTNLTADEAATSMAQLMNIMQTAPGDVGRLGASLVALGNDGASTERDIIQMSQRIAGAGKIIGLTEGEVLGFANALASVGIDVEAGGSAISRIMTDMAKSVSQGGEKLELFSEVAGVSSAEFSKSFKDDPADAVATFVEGLGRVNAAGGDVFTTLDDLGQSDIRVSNALLGMANSGDLLRDSLEMGNASWAENTALLTEAEKRYATVEAQLQKTQGSINDAAISFGETLLPAISDAAAGTADFADFIADLPEPVMAVVSVVAALTTGVALFGGGLLLLAPRMVQTRAAMVQLDMTGKNLAKTLGKGGLLVAGVMVASTAVSGLGRVGELSATDVEKLNAALNGVGDSSKDLDALFSGMQGTTNATNGMAEAARKLTDSGLEGFTYAVNKGAWGATEAVLGWIPAVKDLANGITKNEAQFKSLGGTLAALATNDLPAATDQFNAMLDMMGGGEENAKKLLQLLGDDYSAALTKIAAEAGDASTEQDILNLAMGKGKTAAKLAQEAAKKNTDTLSEMAGVASQASEDISGLAEEIANFGKVTLDANAANRSFEQSVDDATTTLQAQKDEYVEATGSLDGFIASLDIGTQAGRDNEAALDSIAASANEAAAQILTQTGSQDESNAALERGREALRLQLEQFGVTGEAADVYIARLLATPEDIGTKVALIGAEEAAAVLDNLTRNRQVLIQAAIDSGAAPGEAKAAYNAEGGTIVGPGTGTSDSILSWLSNGEEVTRAAMANKHRPLLKAINADRLDEYLAAGRLASGGTAGHVSGRDIRYEQPASVSSSKVINSTVNVTANGPDANEIADVVDNRQNWSLRRNA